MFVINMYTDKPTMSSKPVKVWGPYMTRKRATQARTELAKEHGDNYLCIKTMDTEVPA